ncbi:hypothetical protein [Synechococcus sp. PCC 6312]|uniref:hypothetical protein n=1 Tax=Synechococcus sp. (strain ATCC 27167 / PCC 6312) TaxID=195253 RepID=UPI00029F46B7|nr:hypothetical protein [Synechococcus sp. PCC 6312]AFY62089.1 hypothetical protein Syn6312_3035 [Synechococcus sp. PCC 6312]
MTNFNRTKPDPASWEYLRKTSVKLHNQWVNQHFKTEEGKALSKGQRTLKTACTVTDNDNAIKALFRFWLFYVLVKSRGQLAKDGIAAIPEWYETKWGSVPQLVVIYRKFKNGKFWGPSYPLTIPHWKLKASGTKGYDFPVYQKGNVATVVRLADNSKIFINAGSAKMGERVFKALVKGISVPRVREAKVSFTQVDERRDTSVVYPYKVVFYDGTGNNTKANWEVFFTNQSHQSPR